MAVVYTDDHERLAKATRLLPRAIGGNVITAIPYDPIVHERTTTDGGLTYASVARIAQAVEMMLGVLASGAGPASGRTP